MWCLRIRFKFAESCPQTKYGEIFSSCILSVILPSSNFPLSMLSFLSRKNIAVFFLMLFVGVMNPLLVFAAGWAETQPAGDNNKEWQTVASSSSGLNLVAAVYGGRLYTSDDTGTSWTERTPAGSFDQNWEAVASDQDGSNLIAAAWNGNLYTATGSGSTWTLRDPLGSSQTNAWTSVASDINGTNLFAAGFGSYLYYSGNGGSSWSHQATVANWRSVSVSSSGLKGIAGQFNGRLYLTTDGSTWAETQPDGNADHDWYSVAYSRDGSKAIAAENGGKVFIYNGTSWSDSGLASQNWTAVAVDDTGSLFGAAYLPGILYVSQDGSSGSWGPDQPDLGASYNWKSIAMNGDGSTTLAANGGAGGRLYLYTTSPAVPEFSTTIYLATIAIGGAFLYMNRKKFV